MWRNSGDLVDFQETLPQTIKTMPMCKITSRHSRGQFEQRAPDLTLKEAEEGIDS